jgi:hypothetical protein
LVSAIDFATTNVSIRSLLYWLNDLDDERNKERMDTFVVAKSIAETNVQKRFEDEKAQRRKPKVSIGKFSNYQFDKTKF